MIQINKNTSDNPIKIQNKISKTKFSTIEDKDSRGKGNHPNHSEGGGPTGKEVAGGTAGAKNNKNQKKCATSLTKNRNLYRNKSNVDNLSNKNNNKKNENDMILKYMDKEIKDREKYNKKLNEYNNELSKLEKEKEKVKKLKEDYDNLNANLQTEKAIYNMQKEDEKIKFDNFIEEEMKLINKEKKQISIEQKYVNELRVTLLDTESPTDELFDHHYKIFSYFDDWVVAKTDDEHKEVTGFIVREKSTEHIETYLWTN